MYHWHWAPMSWVPDNLVAVVVSLKEDCWEEALSTSLSMNGKSHKRSKRRREVYHSSWVHSLGFCCTLLDSNDRQTMRWWARRHIWRHVRCWRRLFYMSWTPSSALLLPHSSSHLVSVDHAYLPSMGLQHMDHHSHLLHAISSILLLFIFWLLISFELLLMMLWSFYRLWQNRILTSSGWVEKHFETCGHVITTEIAFWSIMID